MRVLKKSSNLGNFQTCLNSAVVDIFPPPSWSHVTIISSWISSSDAGWCCFTSSSPNIMESQSSLAISLTTFVCHQFSGRVFSWLIAHFFCHSYPLAIRRRFLSGSPSSPNRFLNFVCNKTPSSREKSFFHLFVDQPDILLFVMLSFGGLQSI